MSAVVSFRWQPADLFAGAADVVNDEDQLVVMVAVHDLDVHAGLRHPARDLAQLTGDVLPEPGGNDLSVFEYANAGLLERATCGIAVLEEEVRSACAAHNPCASALDAHARGA